MLNVINVNDCKSIFQINKFNPMGDVIATGMGKLIKSV